VHQKWLRLVVVTIAQAGGILSAIQSSFYAAPASLAVDLFFADFGLYAAFHARPRAGYVYISHGQKVRLLDADLPRRRINWFKPYGSKAHLQGTR